MIHTPDTTIGAEEHSRWNAISCLASTFNKGQLLIKLNTRVYSLINGVQVHDAQPEKHICAPLKLIPGFGLGIHSECVDLP